MRLAQLAEELPSEPVAEEARELAERVSEGRFYVAFVGQFKRGKSTLLNALIAHEVVLTGFVPVTAAPTVIRFGEQRLLHGECLTVTGKTARENLSDVPGLKAGQQIARPLSNPLKQTSHLQILRGNQIRREYEFGVGTIAGSSVI